MEIENEIYRQCHEHMRQTDSKRDQLWAVWAVFIGALITAVGAIDALANQTVLAVAVPVSIVLAFISALYRKWQSLYARAAVVIQVILLSGDHLTPEAIEREWQERVESSHHVAWHSSMVAYAVDSMAVMFNCFIVPVAIVFSWTIWADASSFARTTSVASTTVAVVLLNVVAWLLFHRAPNNRGPEAIYILAAPPSVHG